MNQALFGDESAVREQRLDVEPASRFSNPTSCITGALTIFRIRKVKCDEGKPFCHRCTSTGRRCDGYDAPKKLHSYDQSLQYYEPLVRISTTFNLSAPLSTGDQRQLRQIHLFCNRTALRMSENFEEDALWKRSIPQLAHSEPAVFHAILAVNLVFAQAELNGGGPVQNVATPAIEAYNKAIRYVLRKKSSINSDIYVSLIVCVLFVCLEYLKGDMSLSFRHILGGFMILKDRNLRTKMSNRSGFSSATDGLISELSTVLSRLRVQTLLFDPSLLPLQNSGDTSDSLIGPMPLEFGSLAEARCRFVGLGAEAMSFIREASKALFGIGTFDEHKDTQARLESEFYQWRHAFDRLVGKCRQSWSPQQVKAANIQLMQTLSMSIWISTCLSREQSAFDVFRFDYEKILELAVETVELGMQSTFQFDLGIIPTLHFVGMKCRWPEIRRLALKLLGSAHWREMLFDSHHTYRVVHRVMELEEARNGMASLPAEEDRVILSHIPTHSQMETGGTHQRHTVVQWPNGISAPPVIWDEWIPTTGELPTFEPWIDLVV
jgi:hypothetical protein